MRAKLGLATTLISCLLSTFHSFAAVPEPTSLDPERVERLVGLCKLWAAVKYFHPYLAYRDLDWDAALVAAIPKANQARKPEHYAAAVQGMLASLGDPWTRVVAEAPRVTASPDPKPAGAHDPSYRLTEDKILVISLHHYADLQTVVAADDRPRDRVDDRDHRPRALLLPSSPNVPPPRRRRLSAGPPATPSPRGWPSPTW